MAEPIIPGKKPSEVPSKEYTELDSEALIPVSNVESGVRKDATLKVMQLAPKSHLNNPGAHTDIRQQMKPFDFDFNRDNVPELVGAINLKMRLRVKDAYNEKWDIVQCTTETTDGEITKVQLTGLNGYPNPTVTRFEFTYEDGHWLKTQGKFEIVREAPADGKQYARKNSQWEEIVASGASVGEVTYGTSTYDEVVAAFENNDFVMLKLDERETSVLVITHYIGGDLHTLHLKIIGDRCQGDATVTSENVWLLEVTPFVEEAPSDGKQYARKDDAWSEVTGGGSDIGEITYGTSTFNETLDALQNNAVCVLSAEGIRMVVTQWLIEEATTSLALIVDNNGGQGVARVTSNNVWSVNFSTFVGEAPSDGKTYGRKDGSWTEVEASDTFIATPDETTAEELVNAIDAGKSIVIATRVGQALVSQAFYDSYYVGLTFAGFPTSLAAQPGLFTYRVARSGDTWELALCHPWEAPKDGKMYGRQNAAWHEVIAGDVSSGLITYGETTAAQAELIMHSAYIGKKYPVIKGIPDISDTNHVVLALSMMGYGTEGEHRQAINCLVLPDTTYPSLRVVTVDVDETTNEWSVLGSRDFTPDLNAEEKASGKPFVRTTNSYGNEVWKDFSAVLDGEVVDSGDVFGSGRPTSVFDCSDGSLVVNLFDEGVAYTIANCKYDIVKVENNGGNDIDLVFGPDSSVVVSHGGARRLKWNGGSAHVLRDGNTVYVSGFDLFTELVDDQYDLEHAMAAGVFLPDSTGDRQVSMLGSFDAVFSGMEPSSAQADLFCAAHVNFALVLTPNRLGEAMGVINVSGSMLSDTTQFTDFILEHLKLKYTQTEEGTVVGLGFKSESSSEMTMRATGVDVHVTTDDDLHTHYRTVSNYVPPHATSSETHSSMSVKWTFIVGNT